MRKNILAFLSISVFAVFIIGCATTNAGSREYWKKISSANELTGKWEGSTRALIPENKANSIPKSSIGMDVTLEYIRNAGNLNILYKLDLEKMITDMLSTDIMKQAGVKKDQLWQILLTEFQNADEAGVFTDYGKYYLLVTEKPGTDNLSNCFINEKGNRIRIVFEEALVFGLGDEGISEVILTKK